MKEGGFCYSEASLFFEDNALHCIALNSVYAAQSKEFVDGHKDRAQDRDHDLGQLHVDNQLGHLIVAGLTLS